MIKDAESYKQGFTAGLDIKENNKTMLFGMEVNEILDILEQHLKDKENEMPPKHIMTKTEAIALLQKHMPIGNAAKAIDFYIAAGILEIKEEEEISVKLMVKCTDGKYSEIEMLEIARQLDARGLRIVSIE